MPRPLLLPALLLLLLPLASTGAAPAAGEPPGCGGAVPLSGEGSLVPQGRTCPGIRPGGALISYVGLEFVYCSLGFLVTDGQDVYVTTAGHCLIPQAGAVPGVGERATALGVPGTFGTVAYQWCEGQDLRGTVGQRSCGPGTDFGLIRIDADKLAYASPEMCRWGAPTGGVFEAFDQEPRVAPHFGWGVGVGDLGGVAGVPLGNPATQAREGLLVDATHATHARIATVASSGDSGSGVLVRSLDGAGEPQALGVLTHLGYGTVHVQRLDASLARAGADMGKTFTLVTAL